MRQPTHEEGDRTMAQKQLKTTKFSKRQWEIIDAMNWHDDMLSLGTLRVLRSGKETTWAHFEWTTGIQYHYWVGPHGQVKSNRVDDLGSAASHYTYQKARERWVLTQPIEMMIDTIGKMDATKVSGEQWLRLMSSVNGLASSRYATTRGPVCDLCGSVHAKGSRCPN